MDKRVWNVEFDYRGLRFLLGLVALLLPWIVSLRAGVSLSSISASYHSPGSRDVFVGLLFVVGTFLMAYNGHTAFEALASRVASCAAIMVALFPTTLDGHPADAVSRVHYSAATLLFLILAYFCFVAFRRTGLRTTTRKRRRNAIYLVCGWVMLGCMGAMAVTNWALSEETLREWRVIYFGEMVALSAFGVAWIASGKVLRFIADEDELYRPFGRKRT